MGHLTILRQLTAGLCALVALPMAGTTQAQVTRLTCETTYTEDFGRHGSATFYTMELWVIDSDARTAARTYNERLTETNSAGSDKLTSFQPLTLSYNLVAVSEYQYELTSAVGTVLISRIDGSMSAPGRGADSGADRVEFSGRCQRYEGPML